MNKLNQKSLHSLVNNQLKQIYSKDKKYIDYVFGRCVHMWTSGLEFDKTQDIILVNRYTQLNKKDTSKLKQFGRLQFGYNGLGRKFSAAKTRLFSEATLHDKNTTEDHIVGVTLVGWTVHEEIMKLFSVGVDKDTIVNTLVNEWLSNNLYLWSQAKITKLEHKADNLARDEHTLEEKINLVHYDEGNIKLLFNDVGL